MRTPLLFFLMLTAVCGGCFDGRQKGKFAASGSESHSLANHPGSLTIVRGHALTTDYQPAGTDAPLLYFLVVCPGLQSNGSGSEANEGSYRSTHKLTWFATPKDVAIEFTWDRSNDSVEIHGERYNRTNGNIFVAVRQLDGTISSWQVDSVDADAEKNEIMGHIRKELLDNQVIADVKLVLLDTE